LLRELKAGKKADPLRAMDALARMGTGGKAASRGLCEAILDRQPDVALKAALTLREVNPDLHQRVMPLVIDQQYYHRLRAVQQLAQMGAQAEPAVPLLLHFKAVLLTGLDPSFTSVPAYETNPSAATVLQALYAIAPGDPAWTGQLGKWCLADTNPYVRAMAAALLPKVEEPAAAAKILLRALKGEPEEALRIAVINALGGLGEDGRVAEKLLAELASASPSGATRQAADRALRRIRARQ
jgi:hypothetical protein